MARKKEKPNLSIENIGINPFTSGLEIYAIKKQRKVKNKFDVDDVLENVLEAAPYTKVFEVSGATKQVCDLPIRAKELYLYLIHAIAGKQDCIWIDRVAYMNKMGIRSVNTFKQAVIDLAWGDYVAPHVKFVDVLWINPHFFFKGSRMNKYPNKVIIKKVIEIK